MAPYSRKFEVTGKPPTPVTATGKAGSTATVQCPAGARILNVPRVSYGADGCSSGGAQYVVETRCLLQRECEVPVDDMILDPTQYTCRGVAVEDKVLHIEAECGSLSALPCSP